MLPGVTLSENIVTYEQQILDATIPDSIVIIGAGGIGMEFAYILNSYGVDVQILEYADRPLPNEDADVSKELARQYRRRGIPIQANTRVDSVIDHGDHITVPTLTAMATAPQSTPPARSSVSDFAPTWKTWASTWWACTRQQVGQST
jgi:pyruvate/2-oxoglutarate dehydrogenase complex dihydrolipoamide dehydrogenase (E3) component